MEPDLRWDEPQVERAPSRRAGLALGLAVAAIPAALAMLLAAGSALYELYNRDDDPKQSRGAG